MPQFATITPEQLRFSMMMLIPMACIPAYIAKRKGRSFILWYLYGYGFFIFALIHSMLLMPKSSAGNGPMYANQENRQFSLPDEIILNKRRINYCFIGCPLDTLSYVIIAKPHLNKLYLKLNLYAEKPIKAFDVSVELRDTLNKKITTLEYNNVSYSDVAEFDISEYPYSMYANFTVNRIYLESGEEWVKSGNPIEYDIDILDGYELEKLKELTNKFAVCLPYDNDDYWVCTCSKANNTDKCVLCGIDKKELFEKADSETVRKLKNDLIRRNNLSGFNVVRDN